MSKSMVSLLLVSIALLVVLMTACSDEPVPSPEPTSTPTLAPAPTATPTAGPTATATPTAGPTATATPAAGPTATAVSTQAPDNTPIPVVTSGTLSLDEYLLLCSAVESQEELDEVTTTYGEFSAVMEEGIEMLSSAVPPAEVADWHNVFLEVMTTLKGLVDAQPEDKEIGFEILVIFLGLQEFEEEVAEAVNALPDETRRRMIEAGCIEEPEAEPAGVVDVRDNDTGTVTAIVPGEDAQDDHGNDTDTATVVEVGEDIEGAIDYENDADFFRFSADAGQAYQIDVALGTLGDSVVALTDSDGWEVAYNDDYGNSAASRIVWIAPDSWDYYVEVAGAWFDSTGSYTVTVSLSDVMDDHGNDASTATGVVVGGDTEGILDFGGDIDVFRFSAEAGQVYQIDVALGTLEDSVVALTDSDGWELAYNDDYGNSAASRAIWEATDSGDYYVEVAGAWFDSTGSYTMTIALSDVRDDHGNDTSTATAVGVGDDTEGSIDYEGDTDFFLFSGEAGQFYQIDVALGTLDDSVAYLTHFDGWEVASNDDHGNSAASRIIWGASDSGDYYVGVAAAWGSGTGTGSYTVTISISEIADDYGNARDTATAVVAGEDTEGAIDYEGDADFFRFSAEAGKVYQIDVALGTLDDSVAELQDSNGLEVTYNDDYGDSLASRIVWEAPVSGDYYVVVSGWGTGSYTVTVGQQ